jgi:hypothetical protein
MPPRSHHPLCPGSVLYCTGLCCDYSPFSLSLAPLCRLSPVSDYIPCLESRSILGCDPFSFPYHYFYLLFDVPCPTELAYFSFVPDLHLVLAYPFVLWYPPPWSVPRIYIPNVCCCFSSLHLYSATPMTKKTRTSYLQD